MAKSTENFKPHGYKTISNYGGVEIMLNNTGESVMYSWYGKPTGRWQEIKTTAKGRQYFRIKNTRYYLDEFMLY